MKIFKINIKMIKFQTRAFYFKQLSPLQKNINFPLNLGYNDHYQHHSQYRGSKL